MQTIQTIQTIQAEQPGKWPYLTCLVGDQECKSDIEREWREPEWGRVLFWLWGKQCGTVENRTRSVEK